MLCRWAAERRGFLNGFNFISVVRRKWSEFEVTDSDASTKSLWARQAEFTNYVTSPSCWTQLSPGHIRAVVYVSASGVWSDEQRLGHALGSVRRLRRLACVLGTGARGWADGAGERHRTVSCTSSNGRYISQSWDGGSCAPRGLRSGFWATNTWRRYGGLASWALRSGCGQRLLRIRARRGRSRRSGFCT